MGATWFDLGDFHELNMAGLSGMMPPLMEKAVKQYMSNRQIIELVNQ